MKKSKISLLLVVFFVVSLFSANAFAFSPDSVLSHDIKEADGTSGQDTNSGSGVKTGHIQDGAVTASKIGFYSNVVIVSPSGGDFTNPVDALNSITDASASNPYLVKIMPGVYDIGSSSVQMKEYVDIEGSGENATKITGSAGGVVSGASNAEIRFLTINSSAVGMYNSNVSPKVLNVTITTIGQGQCFGIYNDNFSSPWLTNVTITVRGQSESIGVMTRNNSMCTINNGEVYVSTGYGNYGIYIFDNAMITMKNVTVKASGGYASFGVFNDSGSVYIDQSVLSGSTPLYGGAYVSYSQFDGTTINCPSKSLGLYDGNYDPICP